MYFLCSIGKNEKNIRFVLNFLQILSYDYNLQHELENVILRDFQYSYSSLEKAFISCYNNLYCKEINCYMKKKLMKL